MIIESIYIKNYRCFSEATHIPFSESGLTAILGPNNVGKSTVLKALEILLGDKWPQSQFNEDDFHNNNHKDDIVIACIFNDFTSIQIRDYEIKVQGVAVRIKHLSTGIGKNSLEVEYRMLNSDYGTDTLDFDNLDIACYLNYKGQPSDNQIYISQEIKNQLPLAITIPLIKLFHEQPTNKWSVLGRMMQKVEKKFNSESETKELFEKKLGEAIDELKIEDFKVIETGVKDFWDKMKPKNLDEADIKFLDFDPWHYYRQFKLSIEQYNKDVPIDTLGEGVQRLAIISLYRCYLKLHGRNNRAVLLIEEPESYLHPQARSSLFRVLKGAIISDDETEGQVIYTTHSEDFIDCENFDNLIRIGFDDKLEAIHLDSTALKQHIIALGQDENKVGDIHIQYKLLEEVTVGLKEALFADKAIIVEGPSESAVIKALVDIEKEQIGLVTADGKNNIPAVHAFLTAFGIKCLVVCDRDDSDGTNTSNSKIASILNQEFANLSDNTKVNISEKEINSIQDGDIFIKDRVLIFGKNLETVLSKKIKNWHDLKSKLIEVFKLDAKSKPKLLLALKISYEGNYMENSELEKRINTSNSSIKAFAEILDRFLKQELGRPNLLTPKKLQEPENSKIDPDDIPF